MYDLREKERVDTCLGGTGGADDKRVEPSILDWKRASFFDPGATCSLDPLERPQSDTRNEPVYAPGT